MSTDSTPSMKSLKDKKVYEWTDDELFASIECLERLVNKPDGDPNPCVSSIESPTSFSYHFTNKVFYFILKGGNEQCSDPPDMDLHLQDYKFFRVELWDYRELSEEMKQAEVPTDFKFQMPGFPEFNIKIEYKVWSHQAIDPRGDERFKDQPWAKEFNPAQMGYDALVSPAVFADMVRFCYKISGLKAFW